MINQMYLLLVLSAFVLSGCGTSRVTVPVEDITQANEPTPVTAKGVELAVDPTLSVESSQPVAEPELPEATRETTSSNIKQPDPVVLALISEAEEYMTAQQTDAAINTLERGVRIKPKDPWLWHSMAVIHRQQALCQQAIGLAEKSIALAGSQRDLLFANWQIIHDCRQALNDSEGLKKAKQKLQQYAPRA